MKNLKFYDRCYFDKYGNSKLFSYVCQRYDLAKTLEIGVGMETHDGLQLRHVAGILLHIENGPGVTAKLRKNTFYVKTGKLAPYFSGAENVNIGTNDAGIYWRITANGKTLATRSHCDRGDVLADIIMEAVIQAKPEMTPEEYKTLEAQAKFGFFTNAAELLNLLGNAKTDTFIEKI